MRLRLTIWEVLLFVEMVKGPFFDTVSAAPHRSRPLESVGRPRRTSSQHKIAHVKHSAKAEEQAQIKPPTDYWWQSSVDDPKRGFFQGRTEFRRGATVIGQYQYSDGHVRVRVVYKADQNGFRVLKEERTPLNKPVNDPQPNENSISKLRGGKLLKRNSVPVRTL